MKLLDNSYQLFNSYFNFRGKNMTCVHLKNHSQTVKYFDLSLHINCSVCLHLYLHKALNLPSWFLDLFGTIHQRTFDMQNSKWV